MASVLDVLVQKGQSVFGIEPDATVYQAIERMVQQNVGSLVVMEGDKIAGIITERDYLRKIALQGRTSKTTAVREIMSYPVIVAAAATDVDEALALMTDRHIRHLPVVDGGEVVGLVSIGDLVKHKTREQAFQINYLEDYISGR